MPAKEEGTHLETGDEVTTGEVLGVAGRASRRSSHSVPAHIPPSAPTLRSSQTRSHAQVVLANENAREVPNCSTQRSSAPASPGIARREERTLGHVVRLKDLSLVARSVTVHGKGRVVLVLAEVLLRERDTSSEGNLSANDSVSTEKAGEGERALAGRRWGVVGKRTSA